MVRLDVRINAEELRRILESPSGPVADELRRRGQRVLNRARTLAPVDTGRLRASLTMVLLRDGEGMFVRIGSPLEYARYVHDGTGIYGPRGTMIRPVRARFLAWPAINTSGTGNRRFAGGVTERYVFARAVRGVKGRPFLADALAEAAG